MQRFSFFKGNVGQGELKMLIDEWLKILILSFSNCSMEFPP